MVEITSFALYVNPVALANTAAPAITGTPVIGQTLSCSTGTWTGTGTITYTRQWARDGAPIAGATGATYTLVAADDLADVWCIVTATDDLGSSSAASNAVEVAYAAPVAAAGIADQIFAVDEAITALNVAADFTGGGITYALAPSSAALPAGLSLSSAGVITGTPTAVAGAVNIVVRGTNSGGFDDTGFAITIAAAAAPALSGFLITDNGAGSGSMTLTVDMDCTIYGWIGPTGTTPTDTETRNGTGANGTFSQAATPGGGPYSISLPAGLSGDYRVSVVGQVGASALSNVLTQSPVAFDTLAATLSSPTGTQTGTTSADWSVTSNEAGGTIYAGVRQSGDAALTSAQLIAGSGGAGVAWDSDATPTADANNGGSFTGLTIATEYIVDMVQVDSNGNTSSVVSSAAFTTAAFYSDVPVDNNAVASFTILGTNMPADGAEFTFAIRFTPQVVTAGTRWLWKIAGQNTLYINGATLTMFARDSAGTVCAQLTSGITFSAGTEYLLEVVGDLASGGNGSVSFKVDGGTPVNATMFANTGLFNFDATTGFLADNGTFPADVHVSELFWADQKVPVGTMWNSGTKADLASLAGFTPEIYFGGGQSLADWNNKANNGSIASANITRNGTFIAV